MTKKSPYFSIIIPSKNEEALIDKCLSSVCSQSSKRSYEVILVDGQSTDRTLEIAKKYKIDILYESRPGKTFALQKGLMHAKGKIICFTEADCIVPNNWLNIIDKELRSHPESVAITGEYRFHNSNWYYNFLAKMFIPLGMYIFYLFFRIYPLRTTNYAIYKSILMKVKGLNTHTEELYDVDLSLRLRGMGKVTYIPNFRIQTSDRRIKRRIFSFLKEFFISFFYVAILR